MSTIAYSPSDGSVDAKAFLVGLHADHRPQDIFFARTQSQELRETAWESRLKPMQSWGPALLWGIVILMFAVCVSVVR